MSSNIVVPARLPLLLTTDGILLPGASISISITDTRNMAMIRHHLWNRSTLRSSIVGVVPVEKDSTASVDLHSIGVAALVVQVSGTNWPRPTFTLLLSGICRFRLKEILQETPYVIATIEQLDRLGDATDNDDSELTTHLRTKALQIVDTLSLSSLATDRLKKLLGELPGQSLSDIVASILKLSSKEKLEILDTVDVNERIRAILPIVIRQLETLKLLDDKTKKSKAFSWPNGFKSRASLTPNDLDDFDDIKSLEKRLIEAQLPEKANRIAMKELKRLKKTSQSMPDHAMIRTYLDLMAELPWNKLSQETPCISKARKDLDVAHFGLEKVKKRILEFLAVKQLKNCLKGPILCFVGPPGVGKTSIGKAIASTLNREFHRISLGGVCDQSDIRGHRRTYIGSMPGRIIDGLKVIGVRNPVFLLDEVDKMSAGLHGDPASALLEVLDPEQNHTFTDHYLNVPFDLSQVLFLATANSVSTIPSALLDRMEVIYIPGYSQEEKVEIALRHLIPKQLVENGLNDKMLSLPENSLKLVVRGYTREAGVRNLERKLGALFRSVAVNIAERKTEPNSPVVLDEAAIAHILGPVIFDGEVSRVGQPGVAVGLAWTPMGGELLIVEALRMDGDGKLTLTGQLGDVMKESATIATNWLRSHAREYGIYTKPGSDLLDGTDLHLHFPEGAVEKDGPSAGITIITALISLFTNRSVIPDVAMTGEITLTGLVLPVGGIKEKVLAAHRAGIQRIILPKRNEKNLVDIPKSVQDETVFLFVETIDEVLQAVFEGGFPENDFTSFSSKL